MTDGVNEIKADTMAPVDAATQAESQRFVDEVLLAQHGDADEQYRVGDVVEFPTPDGTGKFAGVVREEGADWLLFDFNHPLAGQPVTFEAQLIGVM